MFAYFTTKKKKNGYGKEYGFVVFLKIDCYLSNKLVPCLTAYEYNPLPITKYVVHQYACTTLFLFDELHE